MMSTYFNSKPFLPVIKASFFRGTARPTVGIVRVDSITSNTVHGNGNDGPMMMSLVMVIDADNAESRELLLT